MNSKPQEILCFTCGLPSDDPRRRGCLCGALPPKSLRVPRPPRVPNDMAVTVPPKKGTES